MKLAKLTDPSEQKIADLHQSAESKARMAVLDAIQCGALLLEKKKRIEHGGWDELLLRVAIPRETARRYMVVAEHYSRADKQLLEGKGLIDLYREFGLIRALEGGGNRNGKQDKQASGGQLFFSFDLFSGFMRVIDAKENPFLNADKAELATARENTVKALALMDEALEAVGNLPGGEK